MLLTKQEIDDAWDLSQDFYAYARAIERAVLAKAADTFGKCPRCSHECAQAIPEGWQEDWKGHVMALWTLGRKYDSTIPDDQLDHMRDMLLSAPQKP